MKDYEKRALQPSVLYLKSISEAKILQNYTKDDLIDQPNSPPYL